MHNRIAEKLFSDTETEELREFFELQLRRSEHVPSLHPVVRYYSHVAEEPFQRHAHTLLDHANQVLAGSEIQPALLAANLAAVVHRFQRHGSEALEDRVASLERELLTMKHELDNVRSAVASSREAEVAFESELKDLAGRVSLECDDEVDDYDYSGIVDELGLSRD